MTRVTVSNLPPTEESAKLIDIKIGQYFTGTTINGINVVGEVFLATTLGVVRLSGVGFYQLYGTDSYGVKRPCADYIVTGYKPLATVNLEVRP